MTGRPGRAEPVELTFSLLMPRVGHLSLVTGRGTTGRGCCSAPHVHRL